MTQNQLVLIIIIVIGIIFFVFGQQWFSFLGAVGNLDQFLTPDKSMEQKQQFPEGLLVQDVKIGDGAEAISGTVLTVHYVGTLPDGTKFDSSRDRNQPFQFVLGAGQVIEGWDKGFAGMKVGGIRKLAIPPELSYGKVAGHPLENATLIFEVELLDVRLLQQ